MIRLTVFFILLSLAIITSIIKNSTKGVDDEIYVIKEILLFLMHHVSCNQTFEAGVSFKY